MGESQPVGIATKAESSGDAAAENEPTRRKEDTASCAVAVDQPAAHYYSQTPRRRATPNRADRQGHSSTAPSCAQPLRYAMYGLNGIARGGDGRGCPRVSIDWFACLSPAAYCCNSHCPFPPHQTDRTVARIGPTIRRRQQLGHRKTTSVAMRRLRPSVGVHRQHREAPAQAKTKGFEVRAPCGACNTVVHVVRTETTMPSIAG